MQNQQLNEKQTNKQTTTKQNKNDIKFEKNKLKLNPGVRPCDEVKILSQKYYISMYLIF